MSGERVIVVESEGWVENDHCCLLDVVWELGHVWNEEVVAVGDWENGIGG